MADSRILLAGLEEYRRILGQHLAQLTAEFQQLDNTWRSFSAVYEGDAADQFREGWMRTTQRFQEYIEQTQKISAMLDERIEHLRAANQTESGIWESGDWSLPKNVSPSEIKVYTRRRDGKLQVMYGDNRDESGQIRGRGPDEKIGKGHTVIGKDGEIDFARTQKDTVKIDTKE